MMHFIMSCLLGAESIQWGQCPGAFTPVCAIAAKEAGSLEFPLGKLDLYSGKLMADE